MRLSARHLAALLSIFLFFSLDRLHQTFEGSISVMLYLCTFGFIHVIELERVRVAMAAQDLIFLIFLRLFGLPPNAEPTDVIVAAVGDKDVVEVS